MSHQRVVILGASHNPERYSYKAMKVLQEHGHETVLVNRGVTEIEGQPVLADIGDVTGPEDATLGAGNTKGSLIGLIFDGVSDQTGSETVTSVKVLKSGVPTGLDLYVDDGGTWKLASSVSGVHCSMSTPAAPTRSGKRNSPPSPKVKASGGVPMNTSCGPGAIIWRDSTSQMASTSR